MALKVSKEYIVAARLADPSTRGQGNFGQDVNWSSVLKALIKNRVPLSSLKNDPVCKDCPLLLGADFQKAEHDETLIGNSQREEYGELRRAFLQKGIQSILIKSTGLSPSFPYTSDNLDTLVQPEHIDSSRQVLNDLGYVELRNIEEPKKWLFRKFKGGESVSAVHIHGLVGWGVPFLDDPVLWKRVRPSEDDPWVMIPSPEDAFLVTVAHAFYENKSFKLLDIARIRYCLHQGDLDFKEVEKIARDRGWEDGLAFCLLLYSQLEWLLFDEILIPNNVLEWARSTVSANAWLSRWLKNELKREEAHFPFRVSFFFGKLLYYRKILKDSYRNLPIRLHDVFYTLVWGIKQKFHIKGQRGMIVSLSGIDGAGKTVHGQALVKAFETSEIKSHIFWNRFGSSAQKNDSRLNEAAISHPSDIAASLARRRQRLHNPLIRSGWLVFNLIGFIVRCNLHVRFPRWFGGVVICDRYLYDAIVEIKASLPEGSRWVSIAEWLLVRLCPRPNLAWLLDSPAEISVGRQPDEKGGTTACEELSKQRLEFATLASKYQLEVLTTSSNLEDTSSLVVRETLRKYYENYSTWVNALLLSNPNQRNPKKGLSKL